MEVAPAFTRSVSLSNWALHFRKSFALRHAQGPGMMQPFGMLRDRAFIRSVSLSNWALHFRKNFALRHAQGPDRIQPFD